MDVSGHAASFFCCSYGSDASQHRFYSKSNTRVMWYLWPVARRPGVMEVMHNLDYCDVLVIGEELSPERESLEIHHTALLGKHLDATNSSSGISIYGR